MVIDRAYILTLIVLLCGLGVASCNRPTKPLPPTGWLADEDARARARSAAVETSAVRFEFQAPGPKPYVEREPAKVKEIVDALAVSMRKQSVQTEAEFLVDTPKDEVAFLDANGRKLTWFVVVPESEELWYGPAFGKLYREAKSHAK